MNATAVNHDAVPNATPVTQAIAWDGEYECAALSEARLSHKAAVAGFIAATLTAALELMALGSVLQRMMAESNKNAGTSSLTRRENSAGKTNIPAITRNAYNVSTAVAPRTAGIARFVPSLARAMHSAVFAPGGIETAIANANPDAIGDMLLSQTNPRCELYACNNCDL